MATNTPSIMEMLSLLNNQAYCRRELAELSGLGKDTVARYVTLLYRRRLIRIAEWHREKTTLQHIAYFEWNQDCLPDKPKPAKLSSAERCKRYKAKKMRIKRMKERNLLA